jgi:hypothetical protein
MTLSQIGITMRRLFERVFGVEAPARHRPSIDLVGGGGSLVVNTKTGEGASGQTTQSTGGLSDVVQNKINTVSQPSQRVLDVGSALKRANEKINAFKKTYAEQ